MSLSSHASTLVVRSSLKFAVTALLVLVNMATATGLAVAQDPPIVERQVIVQVSVGQPGRELTYLVIENLEERPVLVFVTLTKENSSDQNGFGLTLPASYRKSIGFHEPDLAAVRAWLGTANFSVIIHYEYLEEGAPAPPTIAADMVWYSAAPFRQVDKSTAVIRRSVKW